MPKSSKLKSSKKRVKIKDLPAGKKISGKDMKRVKGGGTGMGAGKVSMQDIHFVIEKK